MYILQNLTIIKKYSRFWNIYWSYNINKVKKKHPSGGDFQKTLIHMQDINILELEINCIIYWYILNLSLKETPVSTYDTQ